MAFDPSVYDRCGSEMKEGNIYRWSYRAPKNAGQYGDYHCCSQIAVVKDGRLRDTYWFTQDGRSFGEDDLSRLNLTFIANFADLEKSDEFLAEYFDESDVVNLNHANSTRGNFYLRKGAVRSQSKMLESAKYRLEESQAIERSAASRSERLRASIAIIEAGDTSGYF